MIQPKKILLTLITTLCALSAVAQPQKARQATFTLTTYNAKGEQIAQAPGVFLTKDGIALTAWTPFKDATKAEVKDAKGRTFNVACIYGASELYNVARFCVDGITDAQPLTPATTPAKQGTAAYIMTTQPQKTAVGRTEQFSDKYTYTVLESVSAIKDNQSDGAAVVNDKGDLLGIYNFSKTVQSATDARYADAFRTSALSTSDPALRQTNIRLALPETESDAQLALMLANDRGGDYQKAAARDYIAAFPAAADGYYSLATALTDSRNFAEADKTMQQSVAKAKDKGQAHYDYSRLVASYLTIIAPADSTGQSYAAWTWEKAQQEADAAIAANNLPIYHQQQAETLLGQKKFQEAYDGFMALTKDGKLGGEPYYKAFIAKMQLQASNEELLSLLDQAINASDTAFAADYFLARASIRQAQGKYRDAMRDYIVYENIVYPNVTAAFYYQREQCERSGRIFQPALQDIAMAVILAPQNSEYWCELASISLQVSKDDEAIKAADKCLALTPDSHEAMLIKGIALCEKGEKAEGLKNIQKAKELGNEQADQFLAKYK